MSNMSYCRMQNTFHDLKDCYNNWDDADSEDEINYRGKILKVSEDIAMNYGDKFDAMADENRRLISALKTIAFDSTCLPYKVAKEALTLHETIS